MININKVSKSFRNQVVLDNINLDIKAGDRIALVGSNGAGKTTLIRCLLGEYNCDGEITINGQNPRVYRREVLKRFGFVPQLPPPLKMPVGQLIRFAAEVCDANPVDMESVAQRLGLDTNRIRNQPFVKLSGGQKQKLLISIALGRHAEILIMDEPAANLDPAARHVFFSLLAEKQDHAAMIISSHRLDEVAALVNRVIEMDQGNIVLDDHVADNIDINSQLYCRLELSRKESAFSNTIREWGFKDLDSGQAWEGMVAGPDRLRFLGIISRYAGILKHIQLQEQS